MTRLLMTAMLSFGMTTAACAHGYDVAGLKIAHPYALATPPGATTGGAYLKEIDNETKEPETLLSASSPAADRVEIHDMKMDGDVMRMRAVQAVVIEPGKPVTMAPGGGYHLMLLGLRKPLAIGDQVPLTLQFAHAGKVDVMLHVQARGAEGGDHDMAGMKH